MNENESELFKFIMAIIDMCSPEEVGGRRRQRKWRQEPCSCQAIPGDQANCYISFRAQFDCTVPMEALLMFNYRYFCKLTQFINGVN